MLISVMGDSKYMCPMNKCLYSQASKHQLVTHIRNSHPDKSLYVCRRCSQCFCRLKTVSRHVEKHHSVDHRGEVMFSVYVPHYLNEERFQICNTKFKAYCSLCDFKTKDAGKFNQHFLLHDVHHSVGEIKTEMNESMNYQSRDVDGSDAENTLNTPVKSESVEEFNVLKACELMGVKSDISSDSKSVDETNGIQDSCDFQNGHLSVKDVKCSGLRFVCAICDFKTFTAKSLKKHKESVHRKVETNDSSYEVCNTCGKKVKYLKLHMFVHNAKRYECSLCDYKVVFIRDLKKHMLVHFPERNFECKICAKLFLSCSDLYKHQVVHTGERKFSCDKCGKQFKLNHHLKRHLMTHDL